ncbi:flavodoxin family protein [Streptomyces rimosus]|uniref:flavodoxin family protein n=1 Tax=Streptomyces rimosus TaxID=1927 RepID=UPI000AB59093|nr:NADPH-dependent FMN reductase [Streptomyces rimosus]
MTTPAPSASSAASPSSTSPAAAVPPVVAVAYHSGFGHTAVLAEAVRDGAVLDAADAIVFGSPTYMGTASGAFHVFALAAGFTNSGSKSGDKLHTLQFFTVLAAQHGMHWVSLGLLPGWNSSTASENDLNRLGIFLGAGAQTDSDRGPDGVHKADIATADHLGRRVAAQAAVYAAGRAAVAA